MTFTVREPGVEIQFLQHDPDSVESTPIAAGVLVYMSGDKLVDVISAAGSQAPVGFLMQKIKAAYTDLPTNARFRGDLGTSVAFVGDPVAVACGGIYETDQYHDVNGNGITAGTLLYPNNDGKLADTDENSCLGTRPAAIALQTLTAAQCTAGAMLLIKSMLL